MNNLLKGELYAEDEEQGSGVLEFLVAARIKRKIKIKFIGKINLHQSFLYKQKKLQIINNNPFSTYSTSSKNS